MDKLESHLAHLEHQVEQLNGVVIEQGLRIGERVVTDGQLRLTPGARVEIKNDRKANGPVAGGRS